MTNKEIAEKLIKDGAKCIKGIVIKNVTVTEMDEWVRLGITLNEEVDSFVEDPETREYKKDKRNLIYASTFSISSLLKDDDEAAFAANHLTKHPEAMAMIMSRAKIDIIQQEVKSGEVYNNPFSTTESNTIFDHDVIINYITKLELSDFGKRRLDKLADKMLGFE